MRTLNVIYDKKVHECTDMHITEGCPFSCSLHTFKETKHFDQSLTLKKKAHHANLKFCILHLIILLQSKYYILLSTK